MASIIPFNARQTQTTPPEEAEPLRWSAEVEYRTEGGGEWRSFQFEELSELDALIESGPHWDCLVKCVITLNRPAEDGGLTLEAASRL